MKTYKITKTFEGYESKNTIHSNNICKKDALNEIAGLKKSLAYYGADFIKRTKEKIVFQNNDHSNTIITYSIEEDI